MQLSLKGETRPLTVQPIKYDDAIPITVQPIKHNVVCTINDAA